MNVIIPTSLICIFFTLPSLLHPMIRVQNFNPHSLISGTASVKRTKQSMESSNETSIFLTLSELMEGYSKQVKLTSSLFFA